MLFIQKIGNLKNEHDKISCRPLRRTSFSPVAPAPEKHKISLDFEQTSYFASVTHYYPVDDLFISLTLFAKKSYYFLICTYVLEGLIDN